MKPHHIFLIVIFLLSGYGFAGIAHVYVQYEKHFGDPDTVVVEDTVYLFKPNDKYTNGYIQVDSVWSEEGKRYVTELWIGMDGINYGTKNRK